MKIKLGMQIMSLLKKKIKCTSATFPGEIKGCYSCPDLKDWFNLSNNAVVIMYLHWFLSHTHIPTAMELQQLAVWRLAKKHLDTVGMANIRLTLRSWSEAGIAGFWCWLVDECAELTRPVLFLLLGHIIIGPSIVGPANQAVSDWELAG